MLAFSVQKSFLCLELALALNKLLYEKLERKMLMKLTTEAQQI